MFFGYGRPRFGGVFFCPDVGAGRGSCTDLGLAPPRAGQDGDPPPREEGSPGARARRAGRDPWARSVQGPIGKLADLGSAAYHAVHL